MAGSSTPTGLPASQTNSDYEWVLEFCNFKTAWALPPIPGGKSKGEGIVIAHPDVGYTEHPEILKGQRLLIDEGMNFVDEPGSPPKDFLLGSLLSGDFPAHGTKTASVIMSAEGHPFNDPPFDPELDEFLSFDYNETGHVTGVAPLAKLVPYKVSLSVALDDTSDSNIAFSIYHAIGLQSKHDLGVMSISMGRPELSIEDNIRRALVAAKEKGIVVCAAAGQIAEFATPAEWFSPAFPGSDPNTICVAACNYRHEKLAGAFYGDTVDITTPGINVWHALPQRLAPMSLVVLYSVNGAGTGTSYAAAITAGACALWQAHWGRKWLVDTFTEELIFDLFKIALICSADTLNDTWDTANRGAGALDAKALLNVDLRKLSQAKVRKLSTQNLKTLTTAERLAKLAEPDE